MSVFLMVGLLVCMVTQASCTGSPVFVQTGQDLILDGKKPSAFRENDDFIWIHNTVGILKHNGDRTVQFTEAEFFVQNFSLLLKNVKRSQSGNYSAWVYGQKNVLLAEYQVIVLDPVSSVHLTMMPSRSSDSRRYPVTCTTQDAHVNTTVKCNNGTCSQEGGEASEVTASGASLRIYLVNDLIICNHSNQVSWTEDLLTIEDFSPFCEGSECVSAGFSMCRVKMAVISTGLTMMVSAVICVHIIEKLRKQHNKKVSDINLRNLT